MVDEERYFRDHYFQGNKSLFSWTTVSLLGLILSIICVLMREERDSSLNELKGLSRIYQQELIDDL